MRRGPSIGWCGQARSALALPLALALPALVLLDSPAAPA
jgi:hypothetical protein